ncbi:MAG: SsrA-binding protein SmpB [Nitrospirae bacterium]|nr:SsrA-binding protein SmpB [Candidatus Troglogloeales bacterium]MBI3599008.1 SsrA-binding protein SmpB [Candidatus Troglogloeales bacterium]
MKETHKKGEKKGNGAAVAVGLVATNRKAHHDFFIEETYEAGLALLGTEVKSLRDKRVDLSDSYARFENEELFLYNSHISPYSHGNIANHDPLRKRRLLLNQREIGKIFGKIQQKGFTLIPLRLYFKGGWAKVELGIAKGKKLYDKRAVLAKKTAARDIARGMKR